MAFINRFTTTTNGAITFTGNTLGLGKQPGSQNAGTDDSIGAFIAPTGVGPVPTYPSPPGTTLLYTQNSSDAILNIPLGSTVLYAELIWGGTYISTFSGVDESAFINNPVNFTTPLGTFSVPPDPVTATDFDFTLTGGSDAWYARSADVTALVQAGGSGTYSAGSVVGTVDPLNDFSNSAGWTLAVAYSNPALPTRNMTIFTGGEFVAIGATIDTTVSGFATPAAGAVTGTVFTSAQEGDAIFTGDQALFGPTVATLGNLSGPNNPVNNYFGSQINIADPTNPSIGLVDTSGSFGTFNQDAILGTNIVAGRQGWDITAVDASAQLTNSQTSATLRFTTVGDRYLVNGFGIMIEVNAATLNLVKSVDKAVAAVGETLTYTVNVTNSGVLDATNVIFTDILPPEVTYIPGTFTVDGSPIAGDPNTGINIGTVLASDTVIVQFQVTVDSLPAVNPIIDQATSDYEFEPVPGTIVTASTTSNPVTTQIEEVSLDIVKSADKDFAEVGEVITYSVVLTNTGTVNLTNVFFQDIVPNGGSYVPGTLTVGGVPDPGDPNVGITIGTLVPGVPVTVQFNVSIDTLPVPNPMVNTADVTYDFQLSPGSPIQQGSGTSNPATTQVEVASLDAVKSVDKAFVEIGDTITYTVVLTNTGTVDLNNIVFTDADPDGTSFISGSVTINGFPDLAADPNFGIVLGTLAPGDVITIIYDLDVVSVPPINPTINIGTTVFEYNLAPGEPTRSGTQDTNPVPTQIEEVDVTVVKSSDVTFAEVGDTIVYTIDVINSGTTDLLNVFLTDLIQPDTTFVSGSVLINGLPSSDDPNTGINIGTVFAGTTTTVQFSVTIDAFPAINPVLNTADINFDVIIDPALPPDNRNETSNETQVTVEEADLSIVKDVDKSFAQVGDELTYTTTLKNTGTVPLTNVTFTDPIATGTTFVTDSLSINNIIQPGVNPSTPINLGTLNPGDVVSISYRVTIDSLPVPPELRNISTVSYDFRIDPQGPIESEIKDSNETITQIILGELQLQKTANKNVVLVGDTLIYTVIATNSGNVTLNNVILTDIVPPETSFIPGTVTVNGDPRITANPNVGIALGSIAPSEVVIVSFSIQIDSLPLTGQVSNTASANFSFIVAPNEQPVQGSALSNTVITQVELLLIQFIKSSDKSSIALGETLTYNFIIVNNGTVPINNVIFTDDIPTGTTFVQDSFAIEGTPIPGADPTTGVDLGTIPSHSSVSISFEVILAFVPCPPILVDTGTINYEYQLASAGPIFTGSAISNSVTTLIETASFKQMFVDETLTIPDEKPNIEIIIDVSVEIIIISKELIDTPKGISNEGQILTGKKLIVRGLLCQVIEYVADNPQQSVHSAHFEVPFCTFIVMPETLNDVCQVLITPFIEDVYFKKLDSRRLFKNVTFRLETGV